MTRVICLCGTSASGKTMLSEAYVKDQKQRHYIRTTTTAVRSAFDNPPYDYLMSKAGFETMQKYQTAIADNLWRELQVGLEAVNDHDYHIAILDRSPLDAYIYEALFTLNSQGVLLSKDGVELKPQHWAMHKLTEAYKQRSSLLGTQILFVGLGSMFATDDPKRPPMWVNEKYRQIVIDTFNHYSNFHAQWLRMKPLSNVSLEIADRVNLLNKLNNESFK